MSAVAGGTLPAGSCVPREMAPSGGRSQCSSGTAPCGGVSLARTVLGCVTATRPSFRGKGVGTAAMNHILGNLSKGESIFLDCVSEFVPEYYAGFGFTAVARQKLPFDDGVPIDVTLMKYRKTCIRNQ